MEMSRKYLKAEELLAALLDAGVQILDERGIEASLRVSLKEAIERAGVPRSSVYALLSDGQKSAVEEFHRLLLERVEGPLDSGPTLAMIDEEMKEQAERLESGDPVQLAVALREIIRKAVRVHLDQTANASSWRIFLASLAAAGTGPRNPAALEMHAAAWAGSPMSFLDVYQSTFFDVFGIRVVESMTLEAFTASAANQIDMTALRAEIDPQLTNIQRPTGPGGEMQTWDVAAIAFEGLLLSWTEPDPAKEISADLSVWTRYG